MKRKFIFLTMASLFAVSYIFTSVMYAQELSLTFQMQDDITFTAFVSFDENPNELPIIPMLLELMDAEKEKSSDFTAREVLLLNTSFGYANSFEERPLLILFNFLDDCVILLRVNKDNEVDIALHRKGTGNSE